MSQCGGGWLFPLDAAQIASFCLWHLTPTTLQIQLQIQLGQTAHRLGDRVLWGGGGSLKRGCGTAVQNGKCEHTILTCHISAQAHLKSSQIGSRITFVHTSTAEILAADSTVYDIAILAHSFWYFSPSAIRDTLRAGAAPHLLAALAQAALEYRIRDSTSIIRTVVCSEAVKALARTAGFALESESTVVLPEGMMDGQREVGVVLGQVSGRVEAAVEDERERGVVLAMRDVVRADKEGESYGRLGGKV
ncbi:hypothetical protein BJ138DRAFT_1137842 [Hygrophoropsis aurantiaca]|uniref:Uncharacterized protein n=1 Tax=Hygrophoropsis aurantiaca TaxID=72124 RepID=A0ACB7ZZS3_9AGAM|nr:hypothetical protein BJ138DRAFT_1137842 [Hygrophoropsis aurantiaca]